jgi:hypothetical protein
MFVGTPGKADVGESRFQVVLKAKDFADTTTFVIRVVHVSHPPVWMASPIVAPSIKVGEVIQFNLARYASSIDGDPLVFQMVNGPSWVTLSAAGVMTGTPTTASVGESRAIVRAGSPSGLSADATVVFHVMGEGIPLSGLRE